MRDGAFTSIVSCIESFSISITPTTATPDSSCSTTSSSSHNSMAEEHHERALHGANRDLPEEVLPSLTTT